MLSSYFRDIDALLESRKIPLEVHILDEEFIMVKSGHYCLYLSTRG
jgi:hypothetical protein